MWEGVVLKICKNSNIWWQKEEMKDFPTICQEWVKVTQSNKKSLKNIAIY